MVHGNITLTMMNANVVVSGGNDRTKIRVHDLCDITKMSTPGVYEKLPIAPRDGNDRETWEG